MTQKDRLTLLLAARDNLVTASEQIRQATRNTLAEPEGRAVCSLINGAITDGSAVGVTLDSLETILKELYHDLRT